MKESQNPALIFIFVGQTISNTSVSVKIPVSALTAPGRRGAFGAME
jgi:hypothetical protein